jgi:hypothetical protein
MVESFYKMENNYDCGPCAVAFAICNFDNQFAIPFSDELKLIKERWGWNDHNNAWDNLQDSPWHHFAVLKTSKYNWKIRTCGEVLGDQCGNNKTVILIHSPSHPYLQQHWVVLHGTGPDSVFVHWGDGEIRAISKKDFAVWYAGGSPACAYEVGIGNGKLTWYQKFYVWLTGRFP